MKRREMLAISGATFLSLSAFPFGWAAGAEGKKRRILYFTRSAGFEHSVVKRNGDELAHSEKVFIDMGKKANLEVIPSKDGRIFDGDLDQFDAIAFYTSGNLTNENKQKTPPMSEAGKKKLLDAIAAGKPFVGFHAATDTFRSGGVDPYIDMIGGEFVTHGAQQEALMKLTSPKFPGVEGLGDGFRMKDEWYVLAKLNPKMHVILVQDTEGMTGDRYQRPSFPATWAKMHGKGRVFYTSMGHREDVWTNDTFQKIVLGGISWALGDVDTDITPNLKRVTPDASMA